MVLDPRSGVGESSPATRRAQKRARHDLAPVDSPTRPRSPAKRWPPKSDQPDLPSLPFCGKTADEERLDQRLVARYRRSAPTVDVVTYQGEYLMVFRRKPGTAKQVSHLALTLPIAAFVLVAIVLGRGSSASASVPVVSSTIDVRCEDGSWKLPGQQLLRIEVPQGVTSLQAGSVLWYEDFSSFSYIHCNSDETDKSLRVGIVDPLPVAPTTFDGIGVSVGRKSGEVEPVLIAARAGWRAPYQLQLNVRRGALTYEDRVTYRPSSPITSAAIVNLGTQRPQATSSSFA